MTPAQITSILAERIMGWRTAPGRFLKSNREWLPTRRFQPLKSADDAFRILEVTSATFSLVQAGNGRFTARVSIGASTGVATGEFKAATITVAIARAIGLDVADDLTRSRRA
jgi:hypothetical protein